MKRLLHEEEINFLFRGVGECLWYLQYLEDALTTYISIVVDIKIPGAMALPDAIAVREKNRGHTMGNLIKIIVKENLFSTDLLDRLLRLKKDRDWLVHKSLYSHGDFILTESGRHDIFYKLNFISNEAADLQKVVSKELEIYVRKSGVDVDDSNEKAMAEVEELRINRDKPYRP